MEYSLMLFVDFVNGEEYSLHDGGKENVQAMG